MIVKEGKTPQRLPFDMSDIERSPQGILRYTKLPKSLVAMFEATTKLKPNHEALVELGGERVTYQQFWDRSTRVAGGLLAQGIEPGDRVAINLPNSNNWAYAFFGVLMAGAVVVPVNTRFAEAEVEYIATDSGAKYIFTADKPLPDGEPSVNRDRGQTDLAAIFYTSGTTGFPKGAMTTNENFLANCETIKRCVFKEDEIDMRNLISVPMFHVTGCNSQLLVAIMYGGTTIIMPAFDVQSFLSTIVDERVNVLISVPAIYWLAMNQKNFADFDMSGVLHCTYGGAPTAAEVVGKIKAAWPNAQLGNGFGLTETASVSTFLGHEFCEVRPETVGFAAPVIELDVFEADPETGVGELMIRGQNVVSGYWNKPEQSAEAFRNGWLFTGDLARLDDEGYCQIVDRKKDMVNRGGENVYCVEVEGAIVQHPDVFEVAVIGVPDTMMGEKVGAIIVPQPGTNPDPQDIRQFTKKLIADFKVPQFITFRTEPLPRNAGGKVLKPELRKTVVWGEQLR